MFWGLADFKWIWVDSIVWYFAVSYAVLWVPKCQKEYLTYELDQMQTHVAETRLQRNWFRIVSLVFPIVAPDPSQSIDPWWNEVDFSLHLSWSVFCSSSIQAPFVSRFIDSCWRCERHCCRWKCRRRQNHRRHQRHLRSQSSQRHRRDLWGREDREGVGPLWLWHAWYLLQEHVLRSGGFQMTVGRFRCLVFVVSFAVLWVPKCQKRTWNISLKGHMAETRLQRNQCRIVSSIFPIVAPNSSQSIDPWKWNEVDFSLHLSWSVFCSSSIQAPFVSCFIDSCWRCERHCCRWKCRRRQNHRRHQRHLRSQSSQRHRRDLWGREDREGVGPLWLWHAWYLLQEHVLRSGGFQMTVGRFRCLVFVVSFAVLWVPKCQKRTWNISLKGHMAETRLQRKQCRIVSSIFPIVASNPSQSIDPWKWNEVDFSLHLSWSVFCSSSIQAPFVSRFIDSCWRCERHCCRHQRHLRSLRSQSSQRHRRDLWGREDREGVGPLWLWHAWYLLQEHVLRSGGFQMTVGRFHCLVFVVSCAVLWVPKCQKEYLKYTVS